MCLHDRILYSYPYKKLTGRADPCLASRVAVSCRQKVVVPILQEQVADLSLFHTDLPEKMGLKRTYLPIENEAACVRGADTVRFNQLSPAHQSGPVEHQ